VESNDIDLFARMLTFMSIFFLYFLNIQNWSFKENIKYSEWIHVEKIRWKNENGMGLEEKQLCIKKSWGN